MEYLPAWQNFADFGLHGGLTHSLAPLPLVLPAGHDLQTGGVPVPP